MNSSRLYTRTRFPRSILLAALFVPAVVIVLGVSAVPTMAGPRPGAFDRLDRAVRGIESPAGAFPRDLLRAPAGFGARPWDPSEASLRPDGNRLLNRIGEGGLAAAAANPLTIRRDFYITNGTVWATALSGNTLYIAGEFTRVGPTTGGGVPIDASSGAPVSGFPRVMGQVYAVAPDGSGGWYIGGNFGAVGGKLRQNIAHVLSDNSVSDWDPSADCGVEALALSGGTVYAAGCFSSIGGQPRNSIAALDATTGLATAWDPNPAGNGWAAVRTLAVSGTTVYVGGNFTSIGGQPRNSIAALDATTGLATAWDPKPAGWGGTEYAFVGALAVSGTTIYAGGYFTSIGGEARNNIAAVDATTGLATAWNPNPAGGWATVSVLAVRGTTVYAGGDFTSIGGQARNKIAALDATTGLASAWNPNPDSYVSDLVVSGTRVYAAGEFTSIGGQPRKRIAALDVTTGLATDWDPSANGAVNALAVSGATVYVGGEFTSIGGMARNHIAALDVTTGVATDWAPNADSDVWTLAVSGTTVYAGGKFTSIGGQTRNGIAALDAATGLATAWNPNADGNVRALAVSGATVYAGGHFTKIGGQARSNVAALDATTGLATAWYLGSNGDVWALAVSGATVYAGGSFTIIGGRIRDRIAALDATTGLATDWDPKADRAVYALAVNGTTVYAGGEFANIGGQARNYVGALDATTGLATAWDPSADWSVFALAADGATVFAGGRFTEIGRQTSWNLAALDAATGLATDWYAEPDNDVYALLVDRTTVYAGGSFTRVILDSDEGWWMKSGIVAILPSPTPVALAGVTLDPRTINLKSRGLWVTAHIEPVGFNPSSIVLSSVRLAGSVPPVEKFASIGDQDRDGTPDVMLKFAREGLDPLLKPGVNQLEVTGSLLTGGTFKGSCEVRVIAPPAERPVASLAPNPLNPTGVLTLRLPRPGAVTVRMFDLQGRLVRTVMEGVVLPAGPHEVRIDGRGQRGEILASGVYLYRVETAGETLTGRVAILK